MDNFDSPQALGLFAFIFIAAVLYSSVGHGGASGYLAAMALFGVAPVAMKPLALSMNIMVAGLGFVRLYRAGYFKLGHQEVVWVIFDHFRGLATCKSGF